MATAANEMPKRRRARYSAEYRAEALALAERIGVAAAASGYSPPFITGVMSGSDQASMTTFCFGMGSTPPPRTVSLSVRPQ